jgi:uncharacterized membrane-anchored protein
MMSLGNATSVVMFFLALPLIGTLFYLLAVVKVFRASALSGIVMFFLAPLGGVFMMIRYWGNREHDIRGRMFVALGCYAAFCGFVWWGLRYETNDLQAGQQRHEARPQSELEQRVRYVTAISHITLRNGSNDIPGAKASIEVPQHFRFVDGADLESIYSAVGQNVPAYLVGWLVHESVDLAEDGAWYVEVKWRGEGFFKESDAQKLDPAVIASRAKTTSAKLGRLLPIDPAAIDKVQFAQPPAFDAKNHSATWVFESEDPDNAEFPLECHATRLGRRGALMFELSDMSKAREELCLRSVRLAAARVAFAPGEGYSEHSMFDRGGGTDLAGLISGTMVWAQ